ncbi:hypothetical protein [Methanobrevibacter sp.]|uniref:hypothetical protein n=1 Tax=Methanobrevibacter sp. TaxID=66852 RepID=UPI00388CF8EF
MDLNDIFKRFDDNVKTWHWIVIIQLILLLPTIVIIYAYLFINHDFDALIVLSAFYVLLYGLMFPFIFKNQIEKKYEIHSKIMFRATYQFSSKVSSIYLFAFMYAILIFSYVLDYYLGFILSSFFIIPILSSFFGTRAFNDSSCYVGDDIVLGYPPVYPWIALVVGICSFFYIMKFTNALMAISALTFIVQLIVVLPHIANKIFPFEIRTKKGCLYFIILIIVFYLVLMYLALGNGLLNLPNVSLTPEQIIRKIIHFGSAMILAYLFYRQAKKMNKKSK